MTKEIHIQSRFVVPDEMDEENVEHVLSQFFGDLIRTERFVDAEIVTASNFDEREEQAVRDMLSNIDGERIRAMESVIDKSVTRSRES